MKIVVLDGQALNPGDLSWSGLEAFGELDVYDRTPKELTEERIGNAEIVITNKTWITREIMERSRIRYIGVLATGYNVIDVAAAKEFGVVVSNVPNYSSDAVAQLVFAFILEITSKVALHNEAVHAGKWCESRDFSFWISPLTEIAGKTLGIIGYGSIGRRVDKIARAMGLSTIHVTSREGDLDELLAKSDIISLNCPLTEHNTGMINKESIGKMKDGVIIINTARGPLVNESDLAAALKSGKVGAAGIDVLSTEPPCPENPLLTAPNCYITPHIAWAAIETRARLMNVTVRNLEMFLNGTPQNVVT